MNVILTRYDGNVQQRQFNCERFVADRGDLGRLRTWLLDLEHGP